MKPNIFPFQGSIHQSDRHCLNGHRSALVWFTGLSGSGKSTLAHALEERLFNMGIRSYVLDGDNIRCGLNIRCPPITVSLHHQECGIGKGNP